MFNNSIPCFVKGIFNRFNLDIVRLSKHRRDYFNDPEYQRHTKRRLEHLASLSLDIAGSSVLEVGAGYGDLTDFYIDRGCRVVTSDARQANVDVLRRRYPAIRVLTLDVDCPPDNFSEKFDIVHCYGLLYHLSNPDKAIAFFSRCCGSMLLVCTAVAPGDQDRLNPLPEYENNPLTGMRGKGCRPTRNWVYLRLKKHFPFVYLPVTQPNHTDFPIDWNLPNKAGYSRAIFIASRNELHNPMLTEEIPMKQMRAH